MTAGRVASSIGEANNSALNATLRVARLASRSLRCTARELVEVGARGKRRAGDAVYMARNSVLVRPPRDLVELAATRLFTHATARRIREPIQAAQAATAAYDIVPAMASEDAAVWSLMKRAAEWTEPAAAEEDADVDDDAGVDEQVGAVSESSEPGIDEATSEGDEVQAIRHAPALRDEAAAVLERAASRPVQVRREGYDEQTEAFRARLSFADARLSAEEAQVRCQALRQRLSLPITVRLSLRWGESEEEQRRLAEKPLLRVSGCVVHVQPAHAVRLPVHARLACAPELPCSISRIGARRGCTGGAAHCGRRELR
jgi:hypothetical protein